MAKRVLVVGGSRSGKSAVAERLVSGAESVTYVATATVADAEMAARVAAHRARRRSSWHTVETTDLAGAVRAAPAAPVLIDALGPWVAARMGDHGLWPDAPAEVAPLDEAGAERAEGLLAELDHAWRAAAAHHGGPVVVVAEEVGAGLVPAEAATRRFVDLLGTALQRLSAEADRALWVVAARAVELPSPTAAPGVGGAAGASAPDDTANDSNIDTAGAPPAAMAPPQRVEEAEVDKAEVDNADFVEVVEEPVGLREHGDAMAPEGTLDLAVNVVAGGPPAHVGGALRAAAANVGDYPDDTAACEAVAERHRLAADEVLPTAGATDALWTLTGALAPGRAVVVHPQFTEGEAALRAHGWQVAHVYRDPERNWALDPASVPDTADLVLLCNPVNPLGRLDDPAAIAALRRPGRMVVVDEAFVDFVADEAAATLAGQVSDGDVVVVRTPTKLWGLPGVRAGALLASTDWVAHLRAHRRPWAVGSVGLAALRACADDEAYRRRVAQEVAAERDRLRRRLVGMPEVAFAAEPAANFVCVGVPDGEKVRERLWAQAVVVRPSTFPGLSTEHLRVAVRDTASTDRLVNALAAALGHARPDAERL